MKRKKTKKKKTINPADEAAAFTVEQDIAVLLATLVQKLSAFEKKLDAVLNRVTTASAEISRAPHVPVPVQPSVNTQPPQRPTRQMYAVVCYECGQDCEIPFKPSGNRPVYCKSCFAKRKAYTQKPSPPPSQTVSLSGSNRNASKIVTPPSKTTKKTATKKTTAKKKTPVKKKKAVKKKKTAKKKPIRKKTTKNRK